VLDHNLNWKVILQNALASFRYRMVLVTFLPFSQTTHSVHALPSDGSQVAYGAGIPNVSFNHAELVSHLAPFLVREESLPDTGEHLFYLEKNGSST
jgi:hypothetical protein